jgi:hypothetical protein
MLLSLYILEMAVLVENPPSALEKEMKVTEEVTSSKLAEVIHLKEARFDDRGLIHISTVKQKPEIVKYDMKHKTRSAKAKDSDNKSDTTRPLTGVTNDTKPEVDKTDIQSTLSVTVERKPLHNIGANKHFGDFGRTAAGPHMVIGATRPMSSSLEYEKRYLMARRVPAKMVRLATVTMSAK